MGEDYLSFYHGGLPDDFDFSQLDPFRLSNKQNKHGRDFAGFYMMDEPQIDAAARYRDVNGGELHQIRVPKDVRYYDYPRNIERLHQSDLQQWAADGYDIARGKNTLGRTEYVLLNPQKIMGTQVVDDGLMGMIKNGVSKLGKTASKILPAVGNIGTIYDSYKDMQKYSDPNYWWGA